VTGVSNIIENLSCKRHNFTNFESQILSDDLDASRYLYTDLFNQSVESFNLGRSVIAALEILHVVKNLTCIINPV